MPYYIFPLLQNTSSEWAKNQKAYHIDYSYLSHHDVNKTYNTKIFPLTLAGVFCDQQHYTLHFIPLEWLILKVLGLMKGLMSVMLSSITGTNYRS